MSKLQWDQTGTRDYHVGIHSVALFVSDSTTATGYATGVAWNGVTSIAESPSGAEATDLWANDSKYGSLRSSEQFGGTIEAYMSPVEFDVCDGSASIGSGVVIHQQNRKPFCILSITQRHLRPNRRMKQSMIPPMFRRCRGNSTLFRWPLKVINRLPISNSVLMKWVLPRGIR